MASVFIKVLVSERLPNKGHVTFFERIGNNSVTHWFGKYDENETVKRYAFWLEEIELPTEEETKSISEKEYGWCREIEAFIKGAHFILDKLKGKNNE